jgi:hypothetical protein
MAGARATGARVGVEHVVIGQSSVDVKFFMCEEPA